jgi:hypothetical protein
LAELKGRDEATDKKHPFCGSRRSTRSRMILGANMNRDMLESYVSCRREIRTTVAVVANVFKRREFSLVAVLPVIMEGEECFRRLVSFDFSTTVDRVKIMRSLREFARLLVACVNLAAVHCFTSDQYTL